ncbi:MAG: hypothetical protein GXO77_02955 [Calditrichaeota bacterium]|nr:hypothetical protein [Calditrichota bacterium]
MYLEETYNVYTREGIDYLDYSIFLNRINLLLINIDNATDHLLDEIKSLKNNHPRIKIVLMYTFLPEDSALRKALMLNSDGLIAKPFDVVRLKAKIDSLLRDQENTTIKNFR